MTYQTRIPLWLTYGCAAGVDVPVSPSVACGQDLCIWIVAIRIWCDDFFLRADNNSYGDRVKVRASPMNKRMYGTGQDVDAERVGGKWHCTLYPSPLCVVGYNIHVQAWQPAAGLLCKNENAELAPCQYKLITKDEQRTRAGSHFSAFASESAGTFFLPLLSHCEVLRAAKQ